MSATLTLLAVVAGSFLLFVVVASLGRIANALELLADVAANDRADHLRREAEAAADVIPLHDR